MISPCVSVKSHHIIVQLHDSHEHVDADRDPDLGLHMHFARLSTTWQSAIIWSETAHMSHAKSRHFVSSAKGHRV